VNSSEQETICLNKAPETLYGNCLGNGSLPELSFSREERTNMRHFKNKKLIIVALLHGDFRPNLLTWHGLAHHD
jgi:hypothetical protein